MDFLAKIKAIVEGGKNFGLWQKPKVLKSFYYILVDCSTEDCKKSLKITKDTDNKGKLSLCVKYACCEYIMEVACTSLGQYLKN